MCTRLYMLIKLRKVHMTAEAMVQWAWPLRKKVLAEDSEKEALLNGESDVYPENRDEAISRQFSLLVVYSL